MNDRSDIEAEVTEAMRLEGMDLVMGYVPDYEGADAFAIRLYQSMERIRVFEKSRSEVPSARA